MIAALLRHEARYWQQSQASYELVLGPALTRRVVAAGTLVGADDEESASRLLDAIGELADPGHVAVRPDGCTICTQSSGPTRKPGNGSRRCARTWSPRNSLSTSSPAARN